MLASLRFVDPLLDPLDLSLRQPLAVTAVPLLFLSSYSLGALKIPSPSSFQY
jgi:hypothetical protein